MVKGACPSSFPDAVLDLVVPIKVFESYFIMNWKIQFLKASYFETVVPPISFEIISMDLKVFFMEWASCHDLILSEHAIACPKSFSDPYHEENCFPFLFSPASDGDGRKIQDFLQTLAVLIARRFL